MTANAVRYRVGGSECLLAGRRPSGAVLVAYVNRFGHQLGGYHEVHAHQVIGPKGVHMADIKQAVAALPLVVFSFDPESAARVGAAVATGAAASAAGGGAGRLSAHFSVPTGDN